MSADLPAVFASLWFREDPYGDEVVLHVTLEEAEVIRDVLARVSGNGSRAETARHLFEALEGALGYEVLDDDGFEGEITAPDDSEVFGEEEEEEFDELVEDDGMWTAEVVRDAYGTTTTGVWWCRCQPGVVNALAPNSGKCALCNKTILNIVETKSNG